MTDRKNNINFISLTVLKNKKVLPPPPPPTPITTNPPNTFYNSFQRHFQESIFIKFPQLLFRPLFKKQLFTLLSFSLFLTFSLFLSACSCGVKVDEKKGSSSSSNSFESNYYQTYYEEFSNYTQLTNLVRYKYYVLNNINTNYYFTNSLMTNDYKSLKISNNYFSNYGNITGLYQNQ